MKLELKAEEVKQAVQEYLAKSNIHLGDLTLRTVRRDGEDAIVAEGAVEVEAAE